MPQEVAKRDVLNIFFHPPNACHCPLMFTGLFRRSAAAAAPAARGHRLLLMEPQHLRLLLDTDNHTLRHYLP